MVYHDLASSFGIEPTTVHELAPIMGGGYTEGGIIRTVRTTKETALKRVEPYKLEKCYFEDPITFNTINKGVQMISAAGDSIHYTNNSEKKLFEEFIRKLGRVGEDYTWKELKNYIWHSEMLFGASWIELIWDEEDEEIVDLSRLDPKIMDYARDGNGEIVLDDNQKVVGYTQQLPFGVDTRGKGDTLPEKYKKFISLGGSKIFLLPKRIALIKLFTLSDGYNFIGTVEPAYKSIQRKLMLEEAGTNSAYQRWMAPLVAYIGDDKHPPTANLADKTLKQMKNMKHDLYSTYPYYVKLDSVGANPTDAWQELVKYLRENQSASTGMPMPLATGAGEATNRSTLNNMQNLMEFTLNDIAQRTASSITKYIFRPIAESMGLDSFPELVPNRVSIEEIDDFAVRMNNYVKNKNLRPEDTRKKILEMEGIDAPEEAPPQKEDEKPAEPTEEEDKMNEEEDEKSR